jgi:hypothetical protein
LAQRRDVQRWIEAGQAVGEISKTIDAGLAAELFCATADGLVYRWLVNTKLPMKALHDELRSYIHVSLNRAQLVRAGGRAR